VPRLVSSIHGTGSTAAAYSHKAVAACHEATDVAVEHGNEPEGATMNRRATFTATAMLAVAIIVLSACSSTDSDNRGEQQVFQNDVAGDNPGLEAQIDDAKQDVYAERLFEACWDANSGMGWSEDDLVTYCEENLYEYEDGGVGGGVAPAPQTDETNDCFKGSIEVYIFSYSTADGSGGQVDAAAMCVQDAERAASQMAPPGAYLIHVATA
jgi:hypothetical protein